MKTSTGTDDERINVTLLEEEGAWKIICPSSSLRFNHIFAECD